MSNPDYSFANVDVLMNRNTLRRFFDLCRGASPSRREFRLNLFVVRNTLIVERVEKFNLTRQEVAAGYGKGFEGACSDIPNGLEESECHHRVIEYDFGSLKCAVRFEVDACIPTQRSRTDATLRATTIPLSNNGGESEIRATQRGLASHDDSLVEIKSKKGRPMTIKKNMPQLWFGRLKYLVQGIHDEGTFKTVQIDTVDEHQRFET
jgi:hypothetical protein